MDIVLTVLFPFTASDYPLGIFYCTFNDHCIDSSFSIYGFWLPPYNLLLHIQWPLYWQFFFYLQLLITHLVSFIAHSMDIVLTVLFPFTASDYPLGIFYCTFNGHCIVSSFSIYSFWLPTWYLLLHIQWPLYWQFFFHLRLLITPLVSFIAHSIKSISTQYGSFIKLFWKYLVFKCSSAQARCTPVSSTNKTEHYDTTEILLNVTLSTITLTLNCCISR